MNLDADLLWSLLVGVARQRQSLMGRSFALDDAGLARETPPSAGWIRFDSDAERGWALPRTDIRPTERARWLLDLYGPLLAVPLEPAFVVAHLAQSLDGRVATESGRSQFISGPEDLEHTHRLRALFDAVIVGASTVENDDPRLTTRIVKGPDPVRVVLDPRGRLSPEHRVFADHGVETIVIRLPGQDSAMPTGTHVLEIDGVDGTLPIPSVVGALAARGLRRLFIEGGGITVSKFLQARALDRLHVVVAPLIMGSGRAAFSLPCIVDLEHALRLPCRHFALGADVLFDCPLPREQGQPR